MKPTIENLQFAINEVEIAAEEFETANDKEYAQSKVEAALKELEKIKIEYRHKELKSTIDKIFSDIEQDLMRITLRQTGLRISTKRLTDSIRDIADSKVEIARNGSNTCHTEYVFDSPAETTHLQPKYNTTEEKALKTIVPNHHLRQGRTIPKIATTDSALNVITSRKQQRIAVERTEYDQEGNIYILIRPSMHYIMETSQIIKHPVRETQRHTFAQRQRTTIGTNFLLTTTERKTPIPEWDVTKTTMRRRKSTIIPLHDNIDIATILNHMKDQMYQASQLLIWNGKYVIFPGKRYQEGLRAARQRKIGDRIQATSWMKNLHKYNVGQLRATKDVGTQYGRELEPRTERTSQTESEDTREATIVDQLKTLVNQIEQPQVEPTITYQQQPQVEPTITYQQQPQVEHTITYQEQSQVEPTPVYQQYTNTNYNENQTIQQYPYQDYYNQGYEYYTAATTETWPHPQ